MPILLLLAVLGTVVPVGAPAQTPHRFAPSSQFLSRAELESLAEEYRAALASPAYSEALKAEAREGLERVRTRLEQGDFRVGDRIVLSVQGEETLPDTVPVGPGPSISLPLFGTLSLHGVLRSELTRHLTTEIGRFIRDPVVRAEGLLRVSIQGNVQAPGFYLMPADVLLGEALMIAGGPAPGSDLEGLRIERAGRVLLEGDPLQEAVAEGRTLDQLNFRAGDQITLPATEPSLLLDVGRYALLIGSALLFGIRVF